MPYLNTIGLSGHVVLFAALICVACLGLFTLIGVLRLPSANLRPGLAEGGRSAPGTVWRRLGANLVIVELCVATILQVGAGLLSKSLYQLMHTETGLQEGPLDSDVQARIYTAFKQAGDSNFSVVARIEQAPQNLLPALEKAIHQIDPDLLTMNAETMEDRVQGLQSTYLHRSSAWLSSAMRSE